VGHCTDGNPVFGRPHFHVLINASLPLRCCSRLITVRGLLTSKADHRYWQDIGEVPHDDRYRLGWAAVLLPSTSGLHYVLRFVQTVHLHTHTHTHTHSDVYSRITSPSSGTNPWFMTFSGLQQEKSGAWMFMIRNGCVPVKISALKRSCVVCVRVNSINFVLLYTVTTVHKFSFRLVIIWTPSKYRLAESHRRRNRDVFWTGSSVEKGPCLLCRGESRCRKSTRVSAGTCSCRHRRSLTHNVHYATGKVIPLNSYEFSEKVLPFTRNR